MGRQQHYPVASPVRSRDKRPSTSDAQGVTSPNIRRDRRPNRSLNEMIELVDVKREEFLDELDAIDGCDLMDSTVIKWSCISDKIMASGFSTHFCNGVGCKDK